MESYLVNDDERAVIMKRALKAAWVELQPLLDEQTETKQKVLAGINAFRAAKRAEREGEKELEDAIGRGVICCIDIFSIVASAAYAITVDIDSVDDVNPYCIGGERIEAIMKAAIAMRGVYMMWDAFDDDEDSVFPIYLDEEAGILAERLKA